MVKEVLLLTSSNSSKNVIVNLVFKIIEWLHLVATIMGISHRNFFLHRNTQK